MDSSRGQGQNQPEVNDGVGIEIEVKVRSGSKSGLDPGADCDRGAWRFLGNSNASCHIGWLGSRVVSVLDSGAEGPGFKSQS